jgi:hypothetical protein
MDSSKVYLWMNIFSIGFLLSVTEINSGEYLHDILKVDRSGSE